MALRARCGRWAWRFSYAGREYSGATGLRAIEKTRPAALLAEAEARRLVEQGREAELRLEPKPFDEAVQEFGTWLEGEHREHPATPRRIQFSLKPAVTLFGSLPLHAVTAGQLEDFKTARRAEGIQNGTLANDLSALSRLFQFGRKHNWCFRNPVDEVSRPQAAPEIAHAVTAAEERAYFNACIRRGYQDLHDVARLMLLQGLRPAEVLALTPADVDLARGTLAVRFGKTPSARRRLSLTPLSVAILTHRLCVQLGEATQKQLSIPLLASPQHRQLPIPAVPPAPKYQISSDLTLGTLGPHEIGRRSSPPLGQANRPSIPQGHMGSMDSAPEKHSILYGGDPPRPTTPQSPPPFPLAVWREPPDNQTDTDFRTVRNNISDCGGHFETELHMDIGVPSDLAPAEGPYGKTLSKPFGWVDPRMSSGTPYKSKRFSGWPLETRNTTIYAFSQGLPSRSIRLAKLQAQHQRIVRQLGFDFRIYDWRHTFATRAAEANTSLPTLAAILGHSNLRTLRRYIHVSQAAMDRAMRELQPPTEPVTGAQAMIQ